MFHSRDVYWIWAQPTVPHALVDSDWEFFVDNTTEQYQPVHNTDPTFYPGVSKLDSSPNSMTSVILFQAQKHISWHFYRRLLYYFQHNIYARTGVLCIILSLPGA